MTSSPNSPESAWVLEATIRTAPAADSQWQKQLDRLRQIASYDPETQTWHARLGALDLAGVEMLQALFDAARVHGTEACLTPVAVPTYWDGPVFTRGLDVATLLEVQNDRSRPLGQLPLA
ncbi:hypothetical protein JIX56_00080 [Streptomyces sp. CA-210063]|uniref:hypothetical protein n=1 Tax=Streptomyces sp. CA-210063 TaxID=2801029 RepID=UPI00214CC9BC|nr:hypothetical protein [Streptomyces sp. CA-210063]UUU28449.1 hypothetical protein JIX56_00080 [Streptomyces sp. CA-210063]